MGLDKLLPMVAGSLSSLLVIGGFVAAIFKPVRTWLARWIAKQAQTVDMGTRLDKIEDALLSTSDAINEMNKKLDQHTRENSIDIKNTNEAQALALRCQLREIYSRNYKEGAYTLREQRDVHDIYAAYDKLGGNGYVCSMMDEMRKWKVTDGL